MEKLHREVASNKAIRPELDDQVKIIVRRGHPLGEGGVDRGQPNANRDEEKRPAFAGQPKVPPASLSSKDPHRPDRSERNRDDGEQLANHALRVVANRGATHAAADLHTMSQYRFGKRLHIVGKDV